ncbi:MAG: hypothetical protein ABW206_00070, partial [Agrobacterium vaccinii]
AAAGAKHVAESKAAAIRPSLYLIKELPIFVSGSLILRLPMQLGYKKLCTYSSGQPKRFRWFFDQMFNFRRF